MGTWHLPGGHRITDVPEIPDEFTPTAEEWFWSAIMPPNFIKMYYDKSGETTMYFGLNTSAATIALWRSGGNSFSAYRLMSAARFATSVPGVATAVAVASAAGYVSTSDVHHGATGLLVGDMNMGVPVGMPEEGGSSSNIFPGLKESPIWPWNW